MNTPTKRIKLIPNEKPQQSPKNNNKQKTQETTKQNKKLVLTQQKKTQKQRKPIKNIQYNNIPEQEPIPDTTKMNTAEIIQNTYVEYLPDGTKRDRYRKEFLKKQQLTNNNTEKRKRNEPESMTNETKNKKRRRNKKTHN